ncbi:MAG TPA: orotate phosphoribosyltransferase [Candidatus Nanoarchaeia archaeon]|nr:orotate phosphoribosyltransferase [Candidatus Nanoarchaeia archaeon]
MEQYKQDFIEFMVRSDVLTFGNFTTKSGRDTPYFINTGNFNTGEQLLKLGYFYARAIYENFLATSFSVIFGAAYKGIPLAAITSAQLFNSFEFDYHWCFNRKEAKDHGEGGSLVGYKPVAGDRILLIDDVITAGTATRESIELLRREQPQAKVIGGMISVDRMEKGLKGQSAIQEIETEFDLDFSAIVTVDEIVAHLHNREIDGAVVLDGDRLAAIKEYRAKYGI